MPSVDCGISRPNTLGNVVNGLEEVLVLFLKCFVEGEKSRALHIPMRKMRIGHQGVGIGEDKIQRVDNGGIGSGSGVSRSDGGFHGAISLSRIGETSTCTRVVLQRHRVFLGGSHP
jgi:hypothetical protein